MLAGIELSAYAVGVASFGENLRKMRERANMTQEDVMRALGLKRSAPVSLMESMRGMKMPRAATIRRVAEAVKAEPWELLEGVETEIDRLRNRRDLIRHGDVYQSPARGEHGQSGESGAGTEHASGAAIQSRKAPDAEARLREEVAELRAALETVAKAVVAFGAPETPEAPALAPRKPSRRRRTNKRA